MLYTNYTIRKLEALLTFFCSYFAQELQLNSNKLQVQVQVYGGTEGTHAPTSLRAPTSSLAALFTRAN